MTYPVNYLKLFDRRKERIMVTRLQVTYKNQEIDGELDKKFLKFLNSLDFICVGRTYHPVLFTRSLFFEKQTKSKVEEKVMEEVMS